MGPGNRHYAILAAIRWKSSSTRTGSPRAIVIDNTGREKRFLLRTERGVILELDPISARWFASRWPEVQRALATHTCGAP